MKTLTGWGINTSADGRKNASRRLLRTRKFKFLCRRETRRMKTIPPIIMLVSRLAATNNILCIKLPLYLGLILDKPMLLILNEKTLFSLPLGLIHLRNILNVEKMSIARKDKKESHICCSNGWTKIREGTPMETIMLYGSSEQSAVRYQSSLSSLNDYYHKVDPLRRPIQKLIQLLLKAQVFPWPFVVATLETEMSLPILCSQGSYGANRSSKQTFTWVMLI